MSELKRFVAKTRWEGSCLIWTGFRLPKGYGCARRHRRYIKRNWLAHRLMYVWTKGEIPEGMLVCHSCDNPPCVNPNHLFLGTYSDNMQDCKRKGRLRGHFKPGMFIPTPRNTRRSSVS